MNTKLMLLFGVLMITSSSIFAQKTEVKSKIKKPLLESIKFVDTNCDSLISDQEAQVILSRYMNNPARKSNSDLAQEVQSIIIDLVGYLEQVNCDQMKRSPASGEFIEVFYAEKFDPKKKGL